MEMNILVTGASRKVGLIRDFQDAINSIPTISGKVVGVELDPISSGLYFCDKAYLVPGALELDYIPKLIDICKRERIKLLIPTTDVELVILAKHKKLFVEQGAHLIISDPAAINICHDKYLTYLFLKDSGIPVPNSYLPDNLEFNEGHFPLFIKPRFGRGSQNCFKVKNHRELSFFTEYIETPLIQEFLAGKEYTIDVLADFDGDIISVVPRERISAAAGVSQKGITIKDSRLIDLAELVSRALNLIGPINIQCIADNKEVKVLEINPRFAGGYPLTRAAGVSFCENILRLVMGQKVPANIGYFKEGIVMMRYDEAVFLHKQDLITP